MQKKKTKEEILYTEKGEGVNLQINKSAFIFQNRIYFLGLDNGLLKPKRYNVDFLSY